MQYLHSSLGSLFITLPLQIKEVRPRALLPYGLLNPEISLSEVCYHEHGLLISRVVVEDEAEVVYPVPGVDEPVVLLFPNEDTAGRILDGVSSVNTDSSFGRNILAVYERKLAVEPRGVAIGDLIDAFRNQPASLFERITEVTAVDEEPAEYGLFAIFIYRDGTLDEERADSSRWFH